MAVNAQSETFSPRSDSAAIDQEETVACFVVEKEPVTYASSENGRRSFCGSCGTGLFFVNGPLNRMGMVQVRIAALDDPKAVAPSMQVQVAERIDWMTSVDQLPAFQRFPA